MRQLALSLAFSSALLTGAPAGAQTTSGTPGAATQQPTTTQTTTEGRALGEHVSGHAPEHPREMGVLFGECVSELALTGKDIDAARAKDIGLVNDVLSDEAALLDAARAMARAIAENSPVVVQGVKQVLDYCEGKTIEDGERFVAVWNAAFLASNDLMEAMQAFMEKRPPKFTGT